MVYMALSPDYESTTNEYLHMFNPKKIGPKVYEVGEGEKLWTQSIDLNKSIDADHKAFLS